jgi:Tfp pilus assembly protein PilW
VSPEQTGVEVSHESFVSTGKTTKPSPESENVLKPDDDKQKSNTSPEAGTKKNEVKAPNRLSEFLWLLLIMSVIAFVFTTLWVLLN